MISTAHGWRFASTMDQAAEKPGNSGGASAPGFAGGGAEPTQSISWNDWERPQGWSPPRRCSSDENAVGLAASTTFAQCTNLKPDDILNLLMEDWAVVEKIVPCLNGALDDANQEIEDAVEEITSKTPPTPPAAAGGAGANGTVPIVPPAKANEIVTMVTIPESVTSAIEKELEVNIVKCIQEVQEPGTDAIQLLFEDELKTCNCVPALLQTLPGCGGWKRYQSMGLQMLSLCEADPNFVPPNIVLPMDTTGQASTEPQAPPRPGRGEGPQRPYAPGSGGGQDASGRPKGPPGGPPNGPDGRPHGPPNSGGANAQDWEYNNNNGSGGGNGEDGQPRPVLGPGATILLTLICVMMAVFGGVKIYKKYQKRQGRRGRGEFEEYASYRLNTTEMT